MLRYPHSHQLPEIGRVAMRLLLIPLLLLLLLALVVSFVAPRVATGEPGVGADISSGVTTLAVANSLSPIAAAAVQFDAPPLPHDPVATTHEEFDPVGAGRDVAP